MLISLRHNTHQGIHSTPINSNPRDISDWCTHYKIQTLVVLDSCNLDLSTVNTIRGPYNIWVLERLPDHIGDFLLYAYGVDAVLSACSETGSADPPNQNPRKLVKPRIHHNGIIREQIVEVYALHLQNLVPQIEHCTFQTEHSLLEFWKELSNIWQPNKGVHCLVGLDPITLSSNGEIWTPLKIFRLLVQQESMRKNGTFLISDQHPRIPYTTQCQNQEFWDTISGSSVLLGFSAESQIIFRRSYYPIFDPVLQILKSTQMINQELRATRSL